MLISDFAIKRPLITVVAMLALAVFGLVALTKLKTDTKTMLGTRKILSSSNGLDENSGHQTGREDRDQPRRWSLADC